MIFFDLFLASFTAFIASFLSLSPALLYGLVPWMDTLSSRPPVAPTPSVVPKVLVPDFWEAIPTANISASDISAPAPDPTGTLIFDEEEDEDAVIFDEDNDDDDAFIFDEDDEDEDDYDDDDDEYSDKPTTAELLWELWRLVKQLVQVLTIRINSFINEHPYLPWSPLDSLSLPDEYRPPTIEERFLRLKCQCHRQRNTIRELRQEVEILRLQMEEMRLAPAPAKDLPSPQPSQVSPVQPVFAAVPKPPSTQSQRLDFGQPPQVSPGQPVFASGPKPLSTQSHRVDFGYSHSRSPEPFIFSSTLPSERSYQPWSNDQAGANPFSLDGFQKTDSK